MRRAALVLVLAMALGCSGVTAAPTTTGTTTQITQAGPTPTSAPPTTTTADGGSSTEGTVETPSEQEADLAAFEPDKPDADRLTSYLDDMGSALADTPWGPQSLGSTQFRLMIRDASLAACQSAFLGESAVDIVTAALDETPLGDGDPGSFDPESSTKLLFAVFAGGPAMFCPDLSGMESEAIVGAWATLTGRESSDYGVSWTLSIAELQSEWNRRGRRGLRPVRRHLLADPETGRLMGLVARANRDAATK